MAEELFGEPVDTEGAPELFGVADSGEEPELFGVADSGEEPELFGVAEQAPAPAEEEEDISFIGDFARGVASAPVTIARGIGELAALGVDTAFDTDYVDDVSGAFDSVDDVIAPQGATGEVTRDLLAFGAGFIPIAGWIGRAGMVAKGGKGAGKAASKFMQSAEKFGSTKPGKALLGNRAKVLGATALGGGLYEGVISSGGRSTLSDSVEFLPEALKTERDTGLTGREEAFRQFRNRARQAAEATALGGAFDTALLGLGRGSRALGSAPVVGPALSKTAQVSMKGWDTLGQLASRVPGSQTVKRNARRYFSPGGGLAAPIRGALRDVQNVQTDLKQTVASLLDQYDQKAKKVAKESAKRSQRQDFMEQMERDVLEYLETPVGQRISLKYGDDFQGTVDELAEVANQLEDRLIKNLEDTVAEAPTIQRPFLGPIQMSRGEPGTLARPQREVAKAALETIKANRQQAKTHLSRVYELHRNPAQLYDDLGGKDLLTSKRFKDAEDLLTQLRTRNNTVDPDMARRNARAQLLDVLNLKPLGDDLTPDNIQKAIDNRLRQVRDDVMGTGGGVTAPDAPVFKLPKGILQDRVELTKYAPVRALLGEITSPRERLRYMLDNVVELDTSMAFYNNQARTATSAANALEQLEQGQRPSYVYLPDSPRSPDAAADLEALQGRFSYAAMGQKELTDQAEDYLRQQGYVKLGEQNLDDVAGGRFGTLSGMYVPRELRDSLTAPLQLSMNPLAQLGSMLSQMKGLTQKMTIVPNPASRVRDLLGNEMMVIGSGNTSGGFGQSRGQAMSTIFRAVQNLDQDGTEALARKLNLAGVTDSNVLLNTLKSIADDGPKFGAPEKLRGGIEALETKTPGMAPLLNFFEKTTQGVDALAKARVLLGEEAKMREVLGSVADSEADEEFILDWMQRSGLIERTRSEVDMIGPVATAGRGRVKRALDPVETVAADRTRKFMPTYSEIGTAVREADRLLPFGNFTSFASENIRNMANILETGVRELATQADDDLIAALGRQRAERLVRETRALGAQRLTGLLTVSSILPKTMVRAGQDATGMTDEQMDRLHEQADYFQKGQDLVPLSFDGEGKVEYINLSYTAPYAFVTDSVQAALRGYQERGRLNQSEVEQIGGSIYDLVGSLADPFASESIFFERVRDALPSSGPGSLGIGRGGETQTGARIYDETDSWGDKASRGFAHVLDSVVPAIVKLGATGQKGELEPGRLTRSMLAVPDARGREYSVAEEIGRQITGFTPMEINLKRDFEFAGKAYAPRRSTAKQAANRVIRAADSTESDIYRGWDNYLDSLYREQSQLYNDILSARELGLSDYEIRRNLVQKANLGTAEVNAIMRGEFWPGLTSREIRQDVLRQSTQEDVRRITTRVPWSQLNRISNERRRQPLDPELFREGRDTMAARRQGATDTSGDATAGLFDGVQGVEQSPTPAPAASAAGLFDGVQGVEQSPTPAPAPAPSPAPAPEERQAPPAELLGGNLFDRMRNSELLRQRGEE